ncbi:hypothetical protein BGZ82_003142 [Podila clonocystis]|nr:hypothetical protein BGZ82_003142 [Podila clonocystis]
MSEMRWLDSNIHKEIPHFRHDSGYGGAAEDAFALNQHMKVVDLYRYHNNGPQTVAATMGSADTLERLYLHCYN